MKLPIGRLFQRFCTNPPRGQRDGCCRPRVECLEDRSVPSLTAVQITDIRPGTAGSDPSDLVSRSASIGQGIGINHHPITVGQTLFFAADDGVHGTELWRSDGTASGTSMVKNINGRGDSNPSQLTIVGQTLYFTADDGFTGTQLWKSDGTAAGTIRITDFASSSSSGPYELRASGSQLYFAVNDPSTGGTALWKSNGTGNGTKFVRTFIPPDLDFSRSIDQLTAVNGTLFFNLVTNFIPTGTTTTELWKSNGTGAGTVDFHYANADRLTASGGRLFFDDLTTDSHGFVWYGLFATDKSLHSAALLDENMPFPSVPMVDVNGTLYYVWSQVAFYWGQQPFTLIGLGKSNGTRGGTTEFIALGYGDAETGPANLTAFDGRLYFTLDDGNNVRDLWRSNGTENGTIRAADLLAGDIGFNPADLTAVDTLSSHELFFTAEDSTHGRELWEIGPRQSSGRQPRPRLVRDILPGSTSSSPDNLTISGGIFASGSLFFTASDGSHGTELWRTTNVPVPTIASPGKQDNNEGDTVSLAIASSGGTFSASGLPAGLTIDANTGHVTGVINNQAASTTPYSVTVTVSNAGLDASVQFNWMVHDLTDPSVTNPGPQSNNEGNSVGLFISASDADNDPLTFSATGLPTGLSIDPNSGLISGTIGNQAAGTYQVTVTVTVSDGTTPAQTMFTWAVGDQTTPVVVDPGPQTNNEGNQLQLGISASDADGDPLTFSATGLPPGLVIDPVTGVITGTLGNQSGGLYQVAVSVSDGINVTQAAFTWTVNDRTVPTLVNPGDLHNIVGDVVQLHMNASDADSDPLQFSAVGLPPDLSIDANGIITGTLTTASAGIYAVTISVSDGVNSTFVNFTWTVMRG